MGSPTAIRMKITVWITHRQRFLSSSQGCHLSTYRTFFFFTFGPWHAFNGRVKIRGAILVLTFAAIPLVAQTPAYRAPRTPDGKPDLNGIWQALNEANYDIEMHSARPAMAVRPGPYGPVPAAPVLALGAVGSVPRSSAICPASRAQRTCRTHFKSFRAPARFSSITNTRALYAMSF